MQRFYSEKRDVHGRVEPYATVSVFESGTDTLATIYDPSDTADTPSTAIANPLQTDANGRYGFAAQNGDYDIVCQGSGSQEYRVRVNLFDSTTSSASGAGGNSTEVQYNSGGVLTGASGLTTDGNSLTAKSVKFNTASPVTTLVQGNTYWDTTNTTLSTVLDATNNVILQHGQEVHIACVNKTGSIIANGKAVYINDAQGNRPTCALAKADSLATCQVVGVTTQPIGINDTGLVTVLGKVNDFNTFGFSADGVTLYLSDSTAGELTETAPSSPNYVVRVGLALNTTPSGAIFVNPNRALAADTTMAANTNAVPPTQKAAKTYTDSLRSDLASSSGASMVGTTASVTLATLLQPQSASHSDGTNTVNGSARIFIGNNSPSADDSAILIGRGLTGSYALGSHAVRDESTWTPSGTGFTGYASFDSIPSFSGSIAYNHIHSYQSRIQYLGSAAVSAERGLYHQFTHNGSGVVSNSYGIELADAAGTGTITLQAALYIGQLSRGASNYTIYSSGTQGSYHEGLWQVGSAGIQTSGKIVASNVYTDSPGGNVQLGQGQSTTRGIGNLVLGYQAGAALNGSSALNTLIGYNAGTALTNQASNVFIGTNAGYYSSSSNKLVIDALGARAETDALLYGNFDASVSNQYLRVSGDLISVTRIQHQGKAVTANGSATTFTYPANKTYQYITTSAASLATTLPDTSSAVDGMVITFVSGSAVATATWVAGSGGATIVGAPAALIANTPVRMIYHHATTSWYPY